jgi:hypothetical protein
MVACRELGKVIAEAIERLSQLVEHPRVKHAGLAA